MLVGADSGNSICVIYTAVSLTRRRNARLVSLKVFKKDFESLPCESIRYLLGNVVLVLD